MRDVTSGQGLLLSHISFCSGEVSQIHRTCEWQAEVSGTVKGLKSTSSSIHKIFIEHLFCARQCSKHCGYHISVSKTEGPVCVDLHLAGEASYRIRSMPRLRRGVSALEENPAGKGDGERLVRFK